MLIGVDFDNTIVSYDAIFHKVALERGLIPADTPVNKTAVRDHLRAIGKEDVWTEMQGHVYGARMLEADAYPGVREFFRRCREQGIPLRIISHRSRYPYAGEKHDLHAAARAWIAANDLGLAPEHIFFELTKAEKIARIASTGVTHFIDDLPELLGDPAFPAAVATILFDPGDAHAATYTAQRAGNWQEVSRLIPVPLSAQISALLASASLPSQFEFTPLAGGGNNRVFRIDAESKQYLLKSYFRHQSDPRDRLGAEFGFLQFAWSAGIRQIPQPLASDPTAGLGLYEFIRGEPIRSLTPPHIQQAADFFATINANRSGATSLHRASEACFTIAEHMATVDRRMARLSQIDPTTATGQAAVSLVDRMLRPAWERIRQHVQSTQVVDLAKTDHCVSPSDFGFHNTLERDGKLVFLDFEYAGWDDPAKAICDFFCQPAVPAPMEYFDQIATAFTAHCSNPADQIVRARLLLPVYRVKWCCIMLNEFLPVDSQRRNFARDPQMAETRKRMQLEKVKEAVERIST